MSTTWQFRRWPFPHYIPASQRSGASFACAVALGLAALGCGCGIAAQQRPVAPARNPGPAAAIGHRQAVPIDDRPIPSPDQTAVADRSGLALDGAPKTYQTTFPSAENPLSEGGAWQNRGGPNWHKVQVVAGSAFGTQPGSGTYDDSYAHLSGFPPNQSAQATIYKSAPGGIHEVELLLRWASSSGVTRGYECLLSHNAAYGPQIVRWNGPKDSFDYLNVTVHSSPVPADGDVMKATVIGNAIKLYLNGTLVAEAVDPNSTWSDGDPGIGFYITGDEPNTTFGFKDFKADGI